MRSKITSAVLDLCAALSPAAFAQAAPYQPLHDFDQDVFACFTCMQPPVLGQDGMLYGYTNSGGAKNWGSLYRIAPDGTWTVLHDFGGRAWIPAGQPVQVPNGDLWGVTSNETAGPHRSHGALWRYSKAGEFRVFDSFVGANGATPESLVLAPDGHLYGITGYGGAYGKGELFTVDDSGHIQTVYSFNARDGAIIPYQQLTAGSDGAFYGVAYGWTPQTSGRVAWRYGADGSFRVLHTFDEDYLGSGLTVGPDDALYGVTWYGNEQTNPHGTVYRLTKDGRSFSILHTFDGSDGDQPDGLLNVDAAGRLVGTTLYLGPQGYGTVFRLGIDGTGFATPYAFDGTGGWSPGIDLAADGAGYGASGAGGANGMGNVYKLVLPDF